MTVEEFTRRLEPHLAGMLTVEQAREYLKLAIAKRIGDLTDYLKLLQAQEEQEIAQDVILAKSDISDAGSRREQNECRAEAAYFRCLRGVVALQNARRKSGTDNVDEPDRQEQEHPAHAATSPVEDPPAAPAGAAPAAGVEARGEIEPNVTQSAGTAKPCSEEALQPERNGDSAGSVSLGLIEARLADDPRQIPNYPLRE